MGHKNIAVYGIYPNRVALENAVLELKKSDFRSTDISVLFAESAGAKELIVEKDSKAPEGLAKGATAGAAVGGTLGWLMGIGLMAIPGFGPFVAAGPIMAALAGAGAGGLVGGIAGALTDIGISEYDAKLYEGRLKKGGILLSVHADDKEWKDKAKAILQRTRAEDIGEKDEASADPRIATSK